MTKLNWIRKIKPEAVLNTCNTRADNGMWFKVEFRCQSKDTGITGIMFYETVCLIPPSSRRSSFTALSESRCMIGTVLRWACLSVCLCLCVCLYASISSEPVYLKHDGTDGDSQYRRDSYSRPCSRRYQVTATHSRSVTFIPQIQICHESWNG